MKRIAKAGVLLVAASTILSLASRIAPIPERAWPLGIALADSDSVDEAKAKSLEALEAISKALEDFAKKAKAEAEQATKDARERLRTGVEKACDASLKACQKVCSDDAKCLNACKEGRRQCQSS